MAFENDEDVNDPSIVRTPAGYQVNAPVVSVTPENIPYGAPEKPKYSGGAETLRAAASGLTFGNADEIEAAIRAFNAGAFSEEEYRRIRDQLRKQQAQYLKDYPVAGTAAEIAGGLVVPAGVLGSAYKAGKTAWGMAKAGAGAGAVTGAVTGAGVAPELSLIHI